MKSYIVAAFAAAVSVTSSYAEGDKDTQEKEKCYGIAKAGKNDCGTVNGSHNCAGHSTKDNDPNEWVYTEKNKCEELGGSTTPPAT